MTVCYIDFEFKGLREKFYDLVSCSYVVDGNITSHWLFQNDVAKQKLKDELLQMRRDGVIMCAYMAQAEASAFITLGINPIKFKWVDLYIEYRMLTNNNRKFCTGKQLVKGKIKFLEMKDKDVLERSLVAATYKLTGKQRLSSHKDEMRDLIINSPEFNVLQQKAIIRYCEEDVIHLKDIKEAIFKEFQMMYATFFPKHMDFKTTVFLRGEFAARSALIERIGHPINLEATKRFTENIPAILKEMCEDIQSQFDWDIFKWDKKDEKYKTCQKNIRLWVDEYCRKHDITTWPRTDKTDQPKIGLKEVSKFFSFSHEYPRNNFPAQLIRYLKLNQSLNGFRPTKKKTNFYSFVGSDGRVRPNLGIYGGQTARSQAKATGFIPLKAAWMRVLIEPAPNKLMASIDYGSQEALVSAILSKDSAAYDAYVSGDVYLAFAKNAGAVPQYGTKKDFKRERTIFKTAYLAINFGQGAPSLARNLFEVTGEEFSLEDARALIKQFYDAYPDYASWVENITRNLYCKQNFLMLPCGWTMFGDNDNIRSVGNFPIQGTASSILRKAVALAQDRGLTVVYTLHDAIYIEINKDRIDQVDILHDCMAEAFEFYFEGEQKVWARSIRQDIDIWGPSLIDGYYKTPKGRDYHGQTKYIDERAVSDYERFNKYL